MATTSDGDPWAPPASEPPAPPRRELWRGAAVAALAVAAACAALAVVSWRRGTDWHEVAGQRGQRIVGLEQRLADVEAERDAVQQRLDELAAEKASAEDERELAVARQQQLAEVAALATRVARDLESCVAGTSELLEVVARLDDYDPTDVTRFTQEVDAVCAQALTGNRALQRVAG